MNPNCVPVVLLVALCWMSVGTYAATNTTTMAPNATASNMNATTMAPNATASNMTTMAPNATASNMTTMAPNATASNMTTMAPNATASNMTTMAPNATASNMTTMAPNATASNMTTMAPNATASNMTTMAPNATASNMTTMAPNATASNMTTMAPNATASNMTTMAPNATTSNMTTMAPTTTAAPIVTNTTVTTLQSNISRAGCGTLRLCAAEPSDCDPSTSSSCFLCGIKRTSGRNMDMELAGPTVGYVGLTLKPANGGNETAYICAKINSNKATFICAYLLNGVFTNMTCPVNNVKAKVTGTGVQCSFSATVPNATARTDTSFAVSIQTGTYDPVSGELGTPTAKLQTNTLDLTNTSANTFNTITSTTAGAITVQKSVSQAFLIILGVMSLAWL